MKLIIAKRKRRRRKKCLFCINLFFPSPKMKTRQWACSNPECQRQRHAENQRAWLAKNPAAFLGRYENTRLWLKEHLGYLKKWRRKRRDIQDSVIGVPLYISSTYRDLKSLIYKTPWIVAGKSVFWPP